jgi:hypothetical protein
MKTHSDKIGIAARALEDAIYEELARGVREREAPEAIGRLSELLNAVKNLPINLEPPVRPAAGSQTGPRAGEDDRLSFFLDGEFLVKQGRRQDGTGHYLQRIPWTTADRAASHVDERYGAKTFHPASLSRDLRVPGYQTYAVLALWSRAGYLETPKRGSYRKKRGVSLAVETPKLRDHLARYLVET